MAGNGCPWRKHSFSKRDSLEKKLLSDAAFSFGQNRLLNAVTCASCLYSFVQYCGSDTETYGESIRVLVRVCTRERACVCDRDSKCNMTIPSGEAGAISFQNQR